MIEFEITGDTGPEHTDTPRELTYDEVGELRTLSRLDAIKLHRKLTNSTLGAALREVKRVRGDS